MDQIIRGLASSDIQKDVLSHMDADSLTLETLLTFVEGKESGQASQGLLYSGAGSGNVVNTDKKCGFCGDSHQRGRKFCKAADFKCDCGRTGHFDKMCRSKDKPVQVEMKAAKKDTKKVESSEQVEASWGYPDSNWACQVDIEQTFKLPECISFIENKESQSYLNSFNSNHSKAKREIKRNKIAGAPQPWQSKKGNQNK